MGQSGRRSISVYKPSRHGRRWRIEIRDGVTGQRSRPCFDCEADAWAAFHEARAEAAIYDGPTVGEMVKRFREHLIEKGNRPSTVVTAMFRLGQFFTRPEKVLTELTPGVIQQLYDVRRAKVSPTTHRAELNQVKSFLKWCVARRHLRLNPAEPVQGVGKKQKGKEQLRAGEARLLLDRALALATKGDDGAFAVALALVMGLRAGEIVKRVVRDVDAFSRVLHIEQAKTPAGNRKLEIPEALWPVFEQRLKGRAPLDPLLPGGANPFHRSDWVRANVVRLCKELNLSTVVCAQGLRATHSSLAQEAGVTAKLVAQQLGHESETTTIAHYTRPGLPEEQKGKRVLRVLEGGVAS